MAATVPGWLQNPDAVSMVLPSDPAWVPLEALEHAHQVFLASKKPILLGGPRGTAEHRAFRWPDELTIAQRITDSGHIIAVRSVFIMGSMKIVIYSTDDVIPKSGEEVAGRVVMEALGPAMGMARTAQAMHFATADVAPEYVSIAARINERQVNLAEELGLASVESVAADTFGQKLYAVGMDNKAGVPALVEINTSGEGSARGKATLISGQATVEPTCVTANNNCIAVLLRYNDGTTDLLVRTADSQDFFILFTNWMRTQLKAVFFSKTGVLLGQLHGKIVAINLKTGQFTTVCDMDDSMRLSAVRIGLSGEQLAMIAHTSGRMWYFVSPDASAASCPS